VVATDSQSQTYRSVFAAGCLLFLIAAAVNITVFRVQQKFGELSRDG
jgi:hypothetical protein